MRSIWSACDDFVVLKTDVVVLAPSCAASRAAFVESAPVPLDHVDAHRRMHAAMLGCLGQELFLGNGPLISDWQARLLTLTDDTQCLLERWLDGPASHDHDPESPGALRRF